MPAKKTASARAVLATPAVFDKDAVAVAALQEFSRGVQKMIASESMSNQCGNLKFSFTKSGEYQYLFCLHAPLDKNPIKAGTSWRSAPFFARETAVLIQFFAARSPLSSTTTTTSSSSSSSTTSSSSDLLSIQHRDINTAELSFTFIVSPSFVAEVERLATSFVYLVGLERKTPCTLLGLTCSACTGRHPHFGDATKRRFCSSSNKNNIKNNNNNNNNQNNNNNNGHAVTIPPPVAHQHQQPQRQHQERQNLDATMNNNSNDDSAVHRPSPSGRLLSHSSLPSAASAPVVTKIITIICRNVVIVKIKQRSNKNKSRKINNNNNSLLRHSCVIQLEYVDSSSCKMAFL